MPRIMFLCSGNYGAGKTHWSHLIVGPSNTVALAAPIRQYLFRILNDDRVHSTKQSVKESRFPKTPLLKVLRMNNAPPKVPKKLFIEFQSALAERESLDDVTVRDLLVLMGGSGRNISKNFWVKETIKLMDNISRYSNLACDDVRFTNEKKKLVEYAEKSGITPVHIYIGDPDDNYENKLLYEECDYKVSWY